VTVQDFGLISSVAALRLAFSSYNFEPSVYVPDILTVFLTHTIRSCGNALNKAIKFPPRLTISWHPCTRPILTVLLTNPLLVTQHLRSWPSFQIFMSAIGNLS